MTVAKVQTPDLHIPVCRSSSDDHAVLLDHSKSLNLYRSSNISQRKSKTVITGDRGHTTHM